MNTTRGQAFFTILQPFMRDPGDMFLVVSLETQSLLVCEKDTILEQFAISTSRLGIGIRENSLKTPPGIHRIVEKIGGGAPTGRIFVDRIDTGLTWNGNANENNLVLTRILRLEGLEKGINKGPGVDSYDRYIYIHGTTQEKRIGTPLSHGCVGMRNEDVIRLFDMVAEGTLVYIDPPPVVVNGHPCRRIHFTGIFGSGMSALAQYLRFQGIGVSGSDRFNTSEDTLFIRKSLEELGCTVVPQDGSGVRADVDAVCVSTAIEELNPDIATARNFGIPIIHRSDLLAALIETKTTIAVCGTSGKSTVTAMIFEFLTACEKSPSLISGAGLRRLEKEGMIGNAWSGGSDLLVVEADESDGSLVKYRPQAAVFLNVSKDHKSVDEIKELFRTVISNTPWTASNGDDPVLASLPASIRFGTGTGSSWKPDHEELLPDSVKLFKNGIEYHLPLPGKHNLENLRAALCVCEHFGCDPIALSDAVRRYEGVARRFCVMNTQQNVCVIDDFAHNPAKIKAAVEAARGISNRIIAVYQPHGFGPTRFLKDEYIAAFKTIFQPEDALYLLPIYYAGGTAVKDISSEVIISGLGQVPFYAEAVSDRDALLMKLKADAKSGDCVLVMGARDPSLPALVKKIVDTFGGAAGIC